MAVAERAHSRRRVADLAAGDKPGEFNAGVVVVEAGADPLAVLLDRVLAEVDLVVPRVRAAGHAHTVAACRAVVVASVVRFERRCVVCRSVVISFDAKRGLWCASRAGRWEAHAGIDQTLRARGTAVPPAARGVAAGDASGSLGLRCQHRSGQSAISSAASSRSGDRHRPERELHVKRLACNCCGAGARRVGGDKTASEGNLAFERADVEARGAVELVDDEHQRRGVLFQVLGGFGDDAGGVGLAVGDKNQLVSRGECGARGRRVEPSSAVEYKRADNLAEAREQGAISSLVEVAGPVGVGGGGRDHKPVGAAAELRVQLHGGDGAFGERPGEQIVDEDGVLGYQAPSE